MSVPFRISRRLSLPYSGQTRGSPDYFLFADDPPGMSSNCPIKVTGDSARYWQRGARLIVHDFDIH
jgi:hypothetical protein